MSYLLLLGFCITSILERGKYNKSAMSIINSDSTSSDSSTSADANSHTEHRSDASSWAALSSSQPDDFFQGWLQLQCGFIPGAYCSVLALRRTDEHGQLANDFAPAALWPAASADIEPLSELIENVISRKEGLVINLAQPNQDDASVNGSNNISSVGYGVAYPIFIEQEMVAVVAVGLLATDKNAIEFAMQQLQWGSSWMQVGKLRSSNEGSTRLNKRMSVSIDTLANVLIEDDYNSAVMRFVSELSIALQCERVSFGIKDKKGLKLQFISDSAQFGERMNLVRAIEAVMAEADDQQSIICYPPVSGSASTLTPASTTASTSTSTTAVSTEDSQQDESAVLHQEDAVALEGAVALAHQVLAQNFSECSVMSIPLYVKSECVAVITLERTQERPFSQQDAEFVESVSALIIHALEQKRLNDRSLFAKARASTKTQAERLLGAGYIGRKCIALLLSAFVIFLLFAVGEYRLSTDARIETSLQHVIAAPYDGYIKSSQVRAGDNVTTDKALAYLDDRDLRLEKLKAISEKAKLDRQYQEAIAAYDRASIKIIAAQTAQINAELSLVESRLARATLYPPFDGLVISGDLSQRLGSAVSKGEQLFQVSPLNAFRVILLVPENRIADVQIGQQGSLFLSALPQQPISFTIDRLTPVISDVEGGSYFNVEASLLAGDIALQPGMEGIGKVVIGERKYADIWSRSFLEWLRLKLWSFWG